MLTEKSEEFVTLMFQNIQQQGTPFNIRKTKEPIHITICLFLSHSKESATFGVARHMQTLQCILRHLGTLLYFVRPFCTTKDVSIFS